MITEQEVLKAQDNWANGIVKIGSLKEQRLECEKATDELISTLYAFDLGKVLFKPTKASQAQFRPDVKSAKSYFIGGDSDHAEDNGFAINPWTKVRFENKDIILGENSALAMGNYFFTDLSGQETKVEYTFGYTKDSNNNLKINLHHSSVPYAA